VPYRMRIYRAVPENLALFHGFLPGTPADGEH
jgi:hypothetical protein